MLTLKTNFAKRIYNKIKWSFKRYQRCLFQMQPSTNTERNHSTNGSPDDWWLLLCGALWPGTSHIQPRHRHTFNKSKRYAVTVLNNNHYLYLFNSNRSMCFVTLKEQPVCETGIYIQGFCQTEHLKVNKMVKNLKVIIKPRGPRGREKWLYN